VTRLMIHIIPEDGLGGAEIAARQAAIAHPDRLEVLAIYRRAAADLPNVSALDAVHPLSPLAAVRAAWRARRARVAVFSLWKTVPAMIACAVLAPRTRRVLFLHSDRRVHAMDRLATAIGARLAHEIWADSAGTLAGLGEAGAGTPRRIISFTLARQTGRKRSDPQPRFVFWGRLTALKRLDRAISLFALIFAARPDARLTLIGPDAGCEQALRRQADQLGVAGAVTFTGALDMPAIAAIADDHDIFLQLSDQEGAAMSLIEAMQLGLAPVVTPVGEMGRYVRTGETGLIYETEAQAATGIARLLDDPALFASISAAAVDHWAGGRLYQEEVIAAAGDLAGREV
jgi:glycosyltransferase involved in cell wall biosynthesis